MAKLSTVVITRDADFRTRMTALLHATGTPIAVVRERPHDTSPSPGGTVLQREGLGTVHLAVLDIRHDVDLGLQALEQVKQKWPTTAAFVVAAHADSDLILRAMRGGANEFLTWGEPETAEGEALSAGVHRALSRLTERLGESLEEDKGGTETLSFFGVKGGVGTTTLAVNCAVELARQGKRQTVITDVNPFLGEVGLFLGVRPRFSVLDALDNLHRLDTEFLGELVTSHKSGLDLLSGSERTDRPGPDDTAPLADLLRVLGRRYGYVVIDGGSVTHAASETTVFASDTVFLVTTPEVPSIRNTQRLVDRLVDLGTTKDQIRVLLNRTSDEHLIAPRQIEDALGHAIYHSFLNDYRTVSGALNAGVPLTQTGHSELTEQFQEFARKVAGLELAGAGGESGRKAGHFFGLL